MDYALTDYALIIHSGTSSHEISPVLSSEKYSTVHSETDYSETFSSSVLFSETFSPAPSSAETSSSSTSFHTV